MPTGTLAPNAVLQVFDSSGQPLPGARLWTFLSGTSSADPIYHDAALLVPWPNPAIADAGGFFISLYMAAGAQKWILENQFGVTQWTVNPVTAVASATGSGAGLGQVFDFGGNSSASITATTYAAGATFDKLHPGTAVLIEDSANLVGTYVLEVTGVMFGAGTLTVALVNLSDGAPDTPLVTATLTSTTGAVATSGPITFPAPGADKSYGVKAIVSANSGFVWGIKLVKQA